MEPYNASFPQWKIDGTLTFQGHKDGLVIFVKTTYMAISWDDFEKLDIRTGTIISAQPFERAIKPAYQLEIDFGTLGIKRSSAQITHHYNTDALVGRQVVAIVNFPPKQIANFFSECLVLGVYDSNNHVILLSPDIKVENGAQIG